MPAGGGQGQPSRRPARAGVLAASRLHPQATPGPGRHAVMPEERKRQALGPAGMVPRVSRTRGAHGSPAGGGIEETARTMGETEGAVGLHPRRGTASRAVRRERRCRVRRDGRKGEEGEGGGRESEQRGIGIGRGSGGAGRTGVGATNKLRTEETRSVRGVERVGQLSRSRIQGRRSR